MALICSGSTCAICQALLDSGRVFSTWGVFLPPDDPLVAFCDAGIHWDCYANWVHRTRFAKAYVDFWVENEKLNPAWGRAYLDDLVLVTVNPNPPVEQISVRLYKTGSDIRVPLRLWVEWLKEPEEAGQCSASVEVESLDEALPRLRAALPDSESVVAAVDWASKEALADTERAALAEVRRENLRVVAINKEACRKIELKRKHKGLTCPHCNHHSKEFRYMDTGAERKSYFICKACAHSFGPEEYR